MYINRCQNKRIKFENASKIEDVRNELDVIFALGLDIINGETR